MRSEGPLRDRPDLDLLTSQHTSPNGLANVLSATHLRHSPAKGNQEHSTLSILRRDELDRRKCREGFSDPLFRRNDESSEPRTRSDDSFSSIGVDRGVR